MHVVAFIQFVANSSSSRPLPPSRFQRHALDALRFIQFNCNCTQQIYMHNDLTTCSLMSPNPSRFRIFFFLISFNWDWSHFVRIELNWAKMCVCARTLSFLAFRLTSVPRLLLDFWPEWDKKRAMEKVSTWHCVCRTEKNLPTTC